MIIALLLLVSMSAIADVNVNIATSTNAATIYLGSPSLVKLANGHLVVSHNFSGPGAPTNGSGEWYRSEIYRSTDSGASWSSLGTVDDLYWASLFVFGADLYAVGTTQQFGDLVIRKSTDEGDTWGANEVLDTTTYCTAPSRPVEIDGKLWFAYSISALGAFGDGDLKTAFVSTGDDIMDDTNWTFSSDLTMPAAWEGENWDGGFWTEPDLFSFGGEINILSRIHSDPDTTGYAGLVAVNSTTGELTATSRVRLRGGDKRFYVNIQDNRAWTLTNPNIYPLGLVAQDESRNVLELYSSGDLVGWQRVARLIDGSALDHTQYGYQYVSWLFDGDDIIAAVREADASADNAHNSNLIEFYRFEDWEDRVGDAPL